MDRGAGGRRNSYDELGLDIKRKKQGYHFEKYHSLLTSGGAPESPRTSAVRPPTHRISANMPYALNFSGVERVEKWGKEAHHQFPISHCLHLQLNEPLPTSFPHPSLFQNPALKTSRSTRSSPRLLGALRSIFWSFCPTRDMLE